MSTALAPRIDGRPYLPRNDVNPISQAEQLRDSLYDQLSDICRERAVDAMLAKSPPYSPTVWVRVEIWRHVRSRGDVAGRGWAVLTVEPKPFHRYPQEVRIEYEMCGRKKKLDPALPPSEASLRVLVDYLGGWSARPRLRLAFVRQTPGQLWRPRNKVTGIRTDYLNIAVWVFALLGVTRILSLNVGSGVLLLIGAAAGFIYRLREPRLVLSTGRPGQEPRNLIRLDSWQTVLRGVANHEDDFRTKLTRELEASRPAEANFTTEDIWYWGVDGKEERRQMVITFRRAVGFIQVYAYHNDLYVGWDVHVNGGTWAERVVADGIDRETKLRVVAHTIASGWHIPNEYDVTDANYLSEWIHALVVERVKEAREEYRISQEIDFQILREERRAVVGAERKPDGVARARRSLLKRVG